MDPRNVEPSNKGEGIYISTDLERKMKSLPPESRSKFSRAMEKEERGGREKVRRDTSDKGREKDIEQGDEIKEKSKKSIFDLAKGAERVPPAALLDQEKTMPVEQPLVRGEIKEEAPQLALGELEPRERKEHFFTREQPDLAGVNPGSIQTPIADTAGVAQDVAAPSQKTDVKQLIQQLVETMTTMKADGKTDTSMMIKHPPLFNGVQVTLTGYETARGEFNIAFTNLTQQAKNILDMNLDAFRLGMEQKGHIIHMVTTSAQIEKPESAQSEYFGQGGGRRERESGGEGEKGRERQQG